jgi:hypothetical protein
MNRILAAGGMALAAMSLAACSETYPGSDGNSYAALIHNPSAVASDAFGQQSRSGSCPGSNEAGDPWHPGGYCLPGGRS